jgi:hypothetical protein
MVESTKSRHGIFTYLIILVILIVINSLLARYAAVAWSSAPGVSELYFAIAFMIPFALWFGAWGAIAAYAGCIIGAGLGAMPLTVNLYWSLADLWQVLIPLVAFKAFHADISLKTKRDFYIFITFGWLLNNLVGAAWGSTMLAVGGVSAWSEVTKTFATWLAGNLLVTIVISSLLLRYVTGYFEKWNLTVKGYWF